MQVASELVDGNTGRPPTVRNEPDSETVAKPPALATVRAPGSGHVVLGCPKPLLWHVAVNVGEFCAVAATASEAAPDMLVSTRHDD